VLQDASGGSSGQRTRARRARKSASASSATWTLNGFGVMAVLVMAFPGVSAPLVYSSSLPGTRPMRRLAHLVHGPLRISRAHPGHRPGPPVGLYKEIDMRYALVVLAATFAQIASAGEEFSGFGMSQLSCARYIGDISINVKFETA